MSAAGEDVIRIMREVMLPLLDGPRTKAMHGSVDTQTAMLSLSRAYNALTAAGGDREERAVEASEKLYAAVWGLMWDCTHVEAFTVALCFQRAAVAASAADLTDDRVYTIGDYLELMRPILAAFPEVDLPTPLEQT